ncbi:hypothetical protein [Pseudolysinimonas sp.]|jgi:hypothetical protein|uniref:hypothetical protein n=1 Tax=Pseudolysinimonas sp. TaxID=2680009 RepID=UPI00378423DF
MPDDDLLYPPTQYGAGWLLLLLAIIVALLLVAVLVAVLTRPKRAVTPLAADPAVLLQQLRGEYLARIDDIDRRARSGEIDPRRAHAELSRLMRAFVGEYSGIEAPVMTLRDLVARGVHPSLIDAIGRFSYPSLFPRKPPVDPALGADAARQVVHTWH